MSKENIKNIIQDLDLPLQLNLAKASKISGIPVWTLRKYERDGRIPKGRRIGSRVYISTSKFLEWLEVSDSDN